MSRHFIENAAQSQANAKRRRDEGRGSTVKLFATSAAMYAARGGNVGPGTWDHVLADARARWANARADAIEDYRRAVYPERYAEWEDFK